MADTEDTSLLRDEQGSRSSMRVLLLVVVMPTLVGMTVLEALGRALQPIVWTAWSSIAGMLVVGSFGPRVAQYLGPQLAAIVNAIGQAKRDPREPSRLDKHTAD